MIKKLIFIFYKYDIVTVNDVKLNVIFYDVELIVDVVVDVVIVVVLVE